MVRRKKTLATLPARIYNLGSPAGADLDFSRAELWERMDAPMGAKAVSVPVFLVNEAQMEYIHPPERQRALSPERVREWLQICDKLEDPFLWLSEWEREDWYIYKEIVAIGIYINFLKLPSPQKDLINWLKGLQPSALRDNLLDYFSRPLTQITLRELETLWEEWKDRLSQGEFQQQFMEKLAEIAENYPDVKRNLLDYGDSNFCSDEAKEAWMKLTGPAIFLCSERIVKRADEAAVPVEIVLDKVYYHELGHAIMDTGYTPYDTVWGRTIEESCANWIAYNRFKPGEAFLVQRIINDQPAEYQGYVWLDEIDFKEWIEFIQGLKINYSDIELILETLKSFRFKFGKHFIKTWMKQKHSGFSKNSITAWGKIAKSLLTMVAITT